MRKPCLLDILSKTFYKTVLLSISPILGLVKRKTPMDGEFAETVLTKGCICAKLQPAPASGPMFHIWAFCTAQWRVRAIHRDASPGARSVTHSKGLGDQGSGFVQRRPTGSCRPAGAHCLREIPARGRIACPVREHQRDALKSTPVLAQM